MPSKRKQNLLHGALILSIATLLVKIVGMLFKVPLTNLLGGVGMGYFNTAYRLFDPLYTLSVAGLPVAVSRMVAQTATVGRYKDVRRILKISRSLFLATGIAGFLIMACFSKLFVSLIDNHGALWSVLALSPAVFFGCVMATYRGYYEGMRNMYPTAISQVIEAVIKLFAGIVLAYLIMDAGLAQYDTNGMVFGRAAASLAEARAMILPYASAGAIFGVTLSTMGGAVFLLIRHRIVGDGVTRVDIANSPEPYSGTSIVRKLWKMAIPVCLGSLALNISSLIDLVSVMNRLGVVVENNLDTLLTMYAGNISDEVLHDSSLMANYLYGIFSTYPTTFFNIVPAITTTLGVSALPNVTAAWTERNPRAMKRNVTATLRFAALIAMPAGFGFIALAEQILSLIFSNAQEIAVAVPMMRVMGAAVLFCALVGPINSILQAIGRVDLPVKFMAVGAAVKLAMNFFLVSVPEINIQAAPYGTLVCYLIISVLGLIALTRLTGVWLNIIIVFGKPLFAAALCAVAAWVSHPLLAAPLGSKLATLISIALAAVVYLFVLFLIRGISEEDILMLPKGEKIAKILAKFRIIG